MKIWHNPRCRKSREALELLQGNGQTPEVIEYLKNPPTRKELKDIVGLLNIKPEDLVRKGEQIFKDKYKGKSLTDEQWMDALLENPVLIERPVVISGKKAVIGRPPEKVLELI